MQHSMISETYKQQNKPATWSIQDLVLKLAGLKKKCLNTFEHIYIYTVCPRTDTNRQTRTGTNRGVMEPVNENEPQEPNRKCVGTEPKIIVIF